MTAEEIKGVYNTTLRQAVDEEKRRLQEYERERESSYSFNHPNTNLNEEDASYWAKMSYWTMEETLALLFGKRPTMVNWDKINHYKDKSPFAKEYGKIRELILRAISTNELTHEDARNKYGEIIVGAKIKPIDFINFAKLKSIQLPEMLEKKIREQSERNQDWEALYKENCGEIENLKEQVQKLQKNLEEAKSLPHGKEIESMQKMIAGMSAENNGYIPGKKNTAAKDIVNDLQKHGINMDEGTVRHYLKVSGNNWLREQFNN